MALKPLNSVAGFSVGETPANVIYANGDVTANNFIASAKSNLGPIGNVFISGGSGNQVIQTDGAGNLSFVTIDTWRVQNGNSNVQVAANSNVTISVSGNANIATFTGTGANINGYLTVEGNIVANGNISANNYIVTPGSRDLIVAPGSVLTRFYSDVNPYSDGGYDLGNGLARWNNVFAYYGNVQGNLDVTGNAALGGVLTDNLYYANGQPWDLQEAAGSNTQIQYNDGLNNFGASANFTFDYLNSNLKITGNANVTGNLVTSNANLGNLATANYVNVANQINGNIANFSGNLTSLNAELGNLATANYVNVASNLVTNNLTANTNVNFTGASNVTLGDVSNLHISGGSADQVLKTDGAGNLSWSSGSILANGYSNVSIPLADGNVYINANAGSDKQWVFGTDGNLTGPATGLADLGNLVIANYGSFSSNVVTGNLISNALTSTRVPYVGVGNNLTDSTNLTWDNPNQVLKIGAGGTELGGDAGYGYIQTTTGNFSGNINSLNANLGNLATANFVNVSSNLNVTDTANVGNLRTNNLLYANGQPWDLQEAAGSNTQIQYNDGLNNFGASANFTFDYAANLLTVGGNATVTGTTKTQQANLTSLTATQVVYGNTDSYLVGSSSFTYDDVNGNLSVTGNIIAGNFYGNVSGNFSAPGANTDIMFNDSNIANAVANFTYNKTFNAGGGQLNVGNTFGGNIITDDLAANNLTASSSISTGSLTVTLDANITGNANVTGNISGNNISASGNISTTGSGGDITMSGGNITGVNDISANTANYASNVRVNNLTVNLELSGNTANFTGNITTLNANLGNLATANYVNVANDLTVLGNITGANLVGSLANGTSNVKVYQDANVEITIGGSSNTATFASTGLYVVGEINTTAGNMLSNGNITANGFLNGANANVTGQAQLGSVLTSNITASTGTITISAAGSNQNIILAPSGLGNVDVGLHNIIQVGAPVNPDDAATKEYVDNISQGLFIHTPANVTSVSNLTATYLEGGTVLSVDSITGNKTIVFSTNHGLVINDDIEFTNTFNGLIAGEQYFVYSTPSLTSITVKNGYNGSEVTTLTNGTTLAEPALGNAGVGATLTNSGTQAPLTIDSILMTVGKRVLVQGQTNQFENGIYDVTTVGTISTDWVLTRSSDGDSYQPKSELALCSGSYLFITQGTQYAGASYVLTEPPGEINIGTSNIVFTQFSKAGSYTSGNGIAITGTIISANVDEVTTTISGGNIVVKTGANLTTPNIGDATFSSLSWNNLSNGNVTANNLSIGNIANITGNLRVDGYVQVDGNISSNANVNGNNAFFTNFVDIGANLLANYVTANYTIFAANANVSGTSITNALTVNLNITGNTANFSGNVFAPAIVQNASTYDTRVSLSSAAGIVEITSNGNSTQFGPSGTITLGGASQIQGGTFGGSGITLGGSQTDIFQNRGGNVTVQVGAGGIIANTWTFAQDGSFTSPGNINSLNANLGNLATANYFTGNLVNGTSNARINGSGGNFLVSIGGTANVLNVNSAGANVAGNLSVTGNIEVNNLVGTDLTANTAIFIGNTTTTWSTVTTSSVSANQTIASYSVANVTGIEFLVKAIDSGGKYSIATVQAVTDGTDVDYSTFGTVQLGGYTGSLAVNVIGGFIRLQVTPASSNSTVWTTQYRLI